jgi:hypothetical protein
MSDGLDILILPDLSVTPDETGATAVEIKISKNYLLIKDIDDLISAIIREVVKRRKLVRTLTISSHGSEFHFRIGHEMISLNDKFHLARIQKLTVLIPFFSKDAIVVISACNTGQDQKLLRAVSKALGGVKVRSFTGDVDVEGIYGSVTPLGDHVICTQHSCQVKSSSDVLREMMLTGKSRGTGYR